MKALQIVAPGNAHLIDLPMPTLEAGEVLVGVEAVATCPHWDMHIMDGIPMFATHNLTYPYTPGEPGHEMVGTVTAVADDVLDPKPGTRIAAWRDPGGRRQGCYAQYVALKADHVLPVPRELPPEEVASLELAMCVQVSVDRLLEINAIANRRCAVVGLGASGLLGIQLLRTYGAREVVGIDPEKSRRTLAEQLGATATIHPDQLPAEGRFGPDAFYATLDTTGLPGPIEAAMSRTLRAVAIFGVLRNDVRFGSDQWWGGFSLIGYGEHNKQAARTALKHILSGKLDLSSIVSARMGIERYQQGVEMLRAKAAIKVLFELNGIQ